MRSRRHIKTSIIFEAAIKVFSMHGFHEAKMDEIARVAGIAKGTIYYHFRSKDELFRDLVDKGVGDLVQGVMDSLRRECTSWERLRVVLTTQLAFCHRNRELTKILLSESFGSEKRHCYLRKRVGAYLDILDGVLQEGLQQGDLPFSHSRETAVAIFGALSILALDCFHDQEIFSEDRSNEEHLVVQCAAADQLIFPEDRYRR